jgi:hypothetical protein
VSLKFLPLPEDFAVMTGTFPVKSSISNTMQLYKRGLSGLKLFKDAMLFLIVISYLSQWRGESAKETQGSLSAYKSYVLDYFRFPSSVRKNNRFAASYRCLR